MLSVFHLRRAAMIRPLVALTLSLLLAPNAQAGQASAPLLALWEFDGWAAPTAERPLGLRFQLLEDGRVVFSPDEPAIDRLIPNAFFQARLTEMEIEVLSKAMAAILQAQADQEYHPDKSRGWTAFIFRDANTGAERRAEVAGHPCLAKGRVFSATAPVAGLRANQNSADRAALSPAMREACNRLAAFHHASTESWSPEAMPALLPQQ
jgi:hypothetical protein